MSNTHGLCLHKVTLNIILNLLLLPLYFSLLLLCVVLAVTPLFPARVARENFKTRLSAGTLAATAGAAAVLFHYALTFIEDFIFWPLGGLLLKDNTQVLAQLREASRSAHAEGRGVGILSAHFGNIEVTADALYIALTNHISIDNPVIALAKPSRAEIFTRFLFWYRGKRKIEVLLTNRRDLVKAILLALKKMRAVAFLVDQKPASGGMFVDFFGAPAAFPEGGIETAARSQCEFVCIASRRLWPGCYTYEGCWLKEERLSAEPTRSILQAYARWLESVIQKSKWQWCWDYRKWSRKPAPQSTVVGNLTPNLTELQEPRA